jgi:hypothetical protein
LETWPPHDAYRRHFGCEVHFDQRADGVVFTNRDLLSPIVDADDSPAGSAQTPLSIAPLGRRQFVDTSSRSGSMPNSLSPQMD